VTSLPDERKKGADAAGGRQTFRSATAVVVWVVWLLFAVGNWIDLAVQGRDHTSAIAAAILLLVTGIAYDTAQRPRIIADEAGVTVRNPLRDHQVGWASVTNVDLTDLLRVHCAQPGERPRIINSWAIHYSRRRQFAADARSRRAARGRRSTFGLPYGTQPSAAGASEEAEAQKCVRALSERATAAQAEAVWAGTPCRSPERANRTRPVRSAASTPRRRPSEPSGRAAGCSRYAAPGAGRPSPRSSSPRSFFWWCGSPDP